MSRKVMVISGINLFQGGPLKVYYDCLDAIINDKYNDEYKVIAFVHKKELFKDYTDKIELIELPNSRKGTMYRLFYEYIFFYFFSLKFEIDIWLSLHDITPNVKAKKRFVYCHNPLIFNPNVTKLNKNNIKDFFYAKLYKQLYRKNIKKNRNVIVQQQWIREKFEELFHIHNAVVARPIIKELALEKELSVMDNYTFLYPAFPREFKNFELICKAVEIIERNSKDKLDYQVWLTIDGTENSYSKDVVEKYKHNTHLKFIGLQKFEEMKELYGKANCLIFPSKLETWGLPISEFKSTGREMLVVDLPYAHETVGSYDKVDFFESDNENELADKMKKSILGKNEFFEVVEDKPKQPYCEGWDELLRYLCD
ncbi:MAG: glycosyltransferase [Wujia sp.]